MMFIMWFLWRVSGADLGVRAGVLQRGSDEWSGLAGSGREGNVWMKGRQGERQSIA